MPFEHKNKFLLSWLFLRYILGLMICWTSVYEISIFSVLSMYIFTLLLLYNVSRLHVFGSLGLSICGFPGMGVAVYETAWALSARKNVVKSCTGFYAGLHCLVGFILFHFQQRLFSNEVSNVCI